MLKAKPPPVNVVESEPEPYEPTSLEGLLKHVHSHGDRQARRWARGVAANQSSLSEKQHERRKSKNKAARAARRKSR